MSINVTLLKDNVNYSLRSMLNLILDNHDCRKYSKYYDNILHFLEALTSDILHIDQYNKEEFNKIKYFILYKTRKMLEYINNIKDDTIKTIDMILKLNELPYNMMNLFKVNINFGNIALKIEFIEIKLLDLFEKYLNSFTKIFIEYSKFILK